MAKTGSLYLIPNIIADGTQPSVIPLHVTDVLRNLRYFLAEDIRTARRYFSSLKIFDSIEALQFAVLNKDTEKAKIEELMSPLFSGNDLGVISESGCPGIADPGSLAVDYAHQKNIRVVPLVGPSSILLALMASGLNGQKFCFHGYIPVDQAAAAKVIQELERESKTRHQTQIFIETPYRTDALFRHFLKHLHPDTKLCVALDLTSPSEEIHSRTIREWKLEKVIFQKTPAIFLFLA